MLAISSGTVSLACFSVRIYIPFRVFIWSSLLTPIYSCPPLTLSANAKRSGAFLMIVSVYRDHSPRITSSPFHSSLFPPSFVRLFFCSRVRPNPVLLQPYLHPSLDHFFVQFYSHFLLFGHWPKIFYSYYQLGRALGLAPFPRRTGTAFPSLYLCSLSIFLFSCAPPRRF